MRFSRVVLLVLVMSATAAPLSAQPMGLRNQLQNSSFESDWLIGSILADRRFNILQRAEVGYGESDGVVDHWSIPVAQRDSTFARSGRYSIKLGANKLSQSVRYAMMAAENRNPTGAQSNFVSLAAADLAKLESRVVRGGAWIKADGLAEGGTVTIAQGDRAHSTKIPAGSYEWAFVEAVSPEPWPAATHTTLTIQGAAGNVWIDDALLGEESLGQNLLPGGDFEQLDAQGWPVGFAAAEPFWWYRYDYYGWTGWSHDGGYGCYTKKLIDLVPGYRWRGSAAVDRLVRHSGRNSLRMVVYPGDNFAVRGPAVPIDGARPFEIGAWVRADRIHEIELMAINADTNEYLHDGTDNFAGLDAQGVECGSKGQGTYEWHYVRKLIAPREPVQRVAPLIAVRGFDGLLIGNNVVGTVWFDDVEVIQRGGTTPTPLPPAPTAELRIVDLDLGDRRFGDNTASVRVAGPAGTAQVQLAITSPHGENQLATADAMLRAGQTAIVKLPYRVETLCRNSREQYQVRLSVAAGGRMETLATAFGTPGSLLATRVSHQFLFPHEKLVIAVNLQISEPSLAEVARLVAEIVDSAGIVVSTTELVDPANKLPWLVPEAKLFEHLNLDRLVTIVPDLSKCRVRPWREATRDYTCRVRLFDRAGKTLAEATGGQFGRITPFDPSGLKIVEKPAGSGIWEVQGKVEVNAEHVILVDGQPFFPVYFGEYGDTFRPEEGVNISRDQIASLGINPRTLSPEQKKKYGMTPGFANGEWDQAGFEGMTAEQIHAAIAKLRQDHPGKLISSNYDFVSHFGSAGHDVAPRVFPAWDIACMEASFASHVPNLRVDWFPAMQGKNAAILVGFENYYCVPYEELRYRSYLSVMRGAAGLGLIPSRMMACRPELNNYLRGLNAEFRSLAGVLAEPSPKLLTTASQPGLFMWEKQHGTGRYLFVVRGEPTLARGLFDWDQQRRTPAGKPAHSEPASDKLAQHLVQNTIPIAIKAGDVIEQEVFVDGNSPRMIALQFRTRTAVDTTWEHRAYWGTADLSRYLADASYPPDQKPPQPWHAWMVVERPAQPINAAFERGAGYYEILGGRASKAVDGTLSMKNLGAVPESGRWQVLKIPATAVGLEGQQIDGLAFSVDVGKVYWGKLAVVSADGTERKLIDGSLERLALPDGPWDVTYTVPGVKAVAATAIFENVPLHAAGDHFSDTLPEPYRARVYKIESK